MTKKLLPKFNLGRREEHTPAPLKRGIRRKLLPNFNL